MAAVTVDTLNVDDAVKAQVRQLISQAGANAVDKAKVEFRAGVAGTRRPEIFDPSKCTITSYFEGFEPFRKVVGLTGSNAIQSFLTYLDTQSLSKVQSLTSLEDDDWAVFKEEVIQALSSPREAVQARFELKKASQRPDETVAQFGERLRNLGRLGYKPNDFPAMESAMKDALAGGVIRDEISIFLIGNSEDTFAKCLEGAIMMDSAFKARSTLKNGDTLAVSVLKNERETASNVSVDRGFHTARPASTHLDQICTNNLPPPMYTSGAQESSHAQTYGGNIARSSEVQAVICYSCQRPGHYASQCPLQAPRANTTYRPNRTVFCHYCGAIGRGSEENDLVVPQAPVNSCDGHVYLDAALFNVPTTFLMDTGASMNLVNENLIKQHGLLSKISKASFKLVGVTGLPLQVLGVIRQAPIVINGIVFEADLVVTSKLNEACILGHNFFEKYKFILNFNDKTLSNSLVSAQLIERAAPNHVLTLRCKENHLISNIKSISCCIFEGETEALDQSGAYLFKPNTELAPLVNDPALFEDYEEPILVENGETCLAFSCDDQAEIWLPKGYVLGHVIPAVRSANLVEAVGSDMGSCFTHTGGVKKQFGWEDTDPRRIEMIVSLLKIRENENLNEQEKDDAIKLISEFPDVFAIDRSEMGRTSMIYHEIPLLSDKPVQANYRRVPFHLREDCIREIQELLDAGIIRPSTSNYNSPAIVLKRKDKVRIVIDYRDLNAISSRSYCSVPALNTLTAGCYGRKLFSTLDMKDGFLQVPIFPEHSKFTAFSVPGAGFYEFVTMSLGLAGGPSTFQQLLDRVLFQLPPDVASAFIDDILSSSYDAAGMISNLRAIFTRIRTSGLRFNPSKCILFQKKTKFLGSYISEAGIEADKDKLDAVRNMSLPRTKKQCQKYIGAVSWFRPHIPNFSHMIKGLTDTLRGDKFKLTDDAISSISMIKEALLSPAILTFPSKDHEFVVMTDSSGYCIGGVIGHIIDGSFKPVAYGSKILSESEQRYPSYKREFLAIKHFIKYWRYYLLSKHFTAITDMKAITYSSFMKKTNCGVILRWILELADYDFTIVYKEGDSKYMALPDLLSRLPSNSDELYSWWAKCTSMDSNDLQSKLDSAGSCPTREDTEEVSSPPKYISQVRPGFDQTSSFDFRTLITSTRKPQLSSLPNCDYDLDAKSLALLFCPASCPTSSDVTGDASPHSSSVELACFTSTTSGTTVSGSLGSEVLSVDRSEHNQSSSIDQTSTGSKTSPPVPPKNQVCLSISLVQVSPPPRRKARKYVKPCLSPVTEEPFHGEKPIYVVRNVTLNGSKVMIDHNCTAKPTNNTSEPAFIPRDESNASSVISPNTAAQRCILSVQNNTSTEPSSIPSLDVASLSPTVLSSQENIPDKMPHVQCNSGVNLGTPHDVLSEPKSSENNGSFDQPLSAYSSELVLESQLKDEDFNKIRSWLKNNRKPDRDEDRSGFSDDLNHYYHLFEHLCLSKNGTVCYKFFFKQSKKFRELLCVPEKLHPDILRSHHDTDHSGHFGPVKTLHRIREKYYFPSMSKKVKLFCNTCETCFLNNHGYQKKPGAPLKLFTANRPNEYLSLDLIGPINGPCRFKYILTMKDRFTKYVQLVPLIDGTSQKIAKALMDHWFFTFGIPEKILSDRANNLTGELMQSVYNIFQVNKIRTTSYHARGNGDCERANKDISIILKKLVKDNYSSWPNKLPYVSFAINTAVHASTGFSPARLQFGRELRTPSDLWFSTTSTETYKSGAHLALATYHDLNEVYKLVRSNLNQSQAGQKKTYDRKKGFHTNYKEKDLVLVWKPLSPAVKDYRKFRNCYSGPWQIKKVLSQWTYLVQHIHNLCCPL
ncbi:hypothetical protein ACHWQZ_G005783 [Mnemiopsis leidyi]